MRKGSLKLIILVLLLLVGVGIIFNRQWIYDYWRGKSYTPTSDMVRIRNSLNLAERGEFLFNASWPALSERDDFNAICRDGESEIAVLGCYAGNNIYIYNITDARLDGIREVTAAHELLHAVYARMNDYEKSSLKPLLEQVYSDNKEELSPELDTYISDQRDEELYVRAGTEIADLPQALEKHYADIFNDQDKIAGYYAQYISVFENLARELENLASEMESLNSEIEQRTAEYERRVERLSADIGQFNSCAELAGCFSTESEFTSSRNALLAEQSSLEIEYNTINNMINDYNAKVEAYNADVLQSQKLNTIINSNSKPEAVK